MRLTARGAFALLAVVVLVVVVLAVGDRDEEDGAPATSDGAAADPSPSATVETATIPEFCAAFRELADRHGARVAEETPENEARVDEQGVIVLEIGRRLPVPEDVRAGLEWFVNDVMREPADATPAQQEAFSTFLTTSCPA